MKRFLFLLLWMPLLAFSQDQKDIDPVAISLIDKMGRVIGSLETCSFDLATVHDETNEDGLLERTFENHQVYFRGPDRMAVRSRGDEGNKGYWYNGSMLTWYSYDENNYITLQVPETIIKTIDSVNATFGFRFPAADLLYPSFGDDIMEEFDSVKFAGIKKMGEVDYFHIIAENDTYNFQLWIENGAYYLPKKYLVIRKGTVPLIEEGTFDNWMTNTGMPDEIFEFTPPKNAELISIMPKQ
ncbi:MAG: DUF2092 domain-containing protein [Robiginitalea sp.]|jgi:hypothetical protein